MNNESLDALVVREEKAQMSAEIKANKQEVRKHRKLERIKPFEELASRHKIVEKKAQSMISMSPLLAGQYRSDSEASPWIVLRHGHEGERSVVGRVTEETEVINGWHNGRYDFNVMAVESDVVEVLRSNPDARFINAHDIAIENLSESTYTGSGRLGNYSSYDILKRGRSVVPDGKFSPVGALHSHIVRRGIQGRVEALEETVQLFEAAIADPDLNPHLQAQSFELAAH